MASITSIGIGRGLDIFELTPNEHLTQNEIDAAKLVRMDYLNVQGQPMFTWPASFVVARAYLDQLARSQGLGTERISAARSALGKAEKASGTARSDALNKLAADLRKDAAGAPDGPKVETLAATVEALAKQAS